MKNKLSVWLIALLVILNIATVSMFWINFNRNPMRQTPFGLQPPEQRTLQFLQQELGLTDAQIKLYDQLRQAHAKQTRPLLQNIRQLKRQMMDEIFSSEPDSGKVVEFTRRIGDIQAEIERLTFEHFLDLKKLCGENQVDKLQELLDEFFRRNPAPGQPGAPAPGYRRPMAPPPGGNR
ncbi:periplasmic heavy metal sensor [candidate division KSB1 bacterium]|nr:periplasmic heavy metal sensor [candidate division KSB1 bacterium]